MNDSNKAILIFNNTNDFQHIYDSIVNKDGWLYKENNGDQLKNFHIIVAHNNSSFRYKYVDIDYNLAKLNKINWNEVIGIQSFAFIKTKKVDSNIRFIENFILKNENEIDEDFNKFIEYCLSLDLMDGSTFNGHEKK